MTKPNRILDQASIDRVQHVRTLAPGAHIHISGICGKGTAALASLLKDLGYRVTGSDKAFYPPMGDVARKIADTVYEGYAAQNLDEKPDLVVIGNSLSADNPEAQAVIEKKIPYASMSEVFSALLIGTRDECPTSIVFAGTHGKTTTSAAAAVMFDAIGRKPGYFVGGVVPDLSSAIRAVDKSIQLEKRVVVLEGDEYDSAYFAKWAKFQSYRPDIVVITSLEFDHADIYESIEEIEEEFTRFVQRVPPSGTILICDVDRRLVEISKKWANDKQVCAEIVHYGLNESSRFRIENRETKDREGLGQKLLLQLDGFEVDVPTMLSGEHNALNLCAVAACGKLAGLSADEICKGLESFSGVESRQQIFSEFDDILVMQDFAHHPTAVKATLEGIRENYPLRRLIAVFEPRSNTSRRGFFQADYEVAFDAAHVAIVQEVSDAGGYSMTNSSTKPLDVELLVKNIAARGNEAIALPNPEQILMYLKSNLRTGDLVVIMSNGDFGGLLEKLIVALKK